MEAAAVCPGGFEDRPGCSGHRPRAPRVWPKCLDNHNQLEHAFARHHRLEPQLQSWAGSRLRGPVFLLHVVTCGEVAWFVSVREVFVEQKWPLLPGGNYECK